MKKITLILLIIALLLALASCTKPETADESSSPASDTDISKSKTESDTGSQAEIKEKSWYYKPLDTLQHLLPDKRLEQSINNVIYNGDAETLIVPMCDAEGDFLQANIVRGYSEKGEYANSYAYFCGPDFHSKSALKYSFDIIDGAREEYRVFVGLLPENMQGMTAEELLRNETDYYELFDIKSGSVFSAGTKIDYVYREYGEDVNSFGLSVLYEKFFVLILPTDIESDTAKTPYLNFDKIVFAKQNIEKDKLNLIWYAIRSNGMTVITSRSYMLSGTPAGSKSLHTVYDSEGNAIKEFRAYNFSTDMYDSTGRIWIRETKEGSVYKIVYCNVLGEELLLNNADCITRWNGEKGEYIGIENGVAYIYDGNDNRRKYDSVHKIVASLGGTDAVKLNDAVYGLMQNDCFVRLYETDFEHDDAALFYNEQYNAIFVGGDAIFEIVNRYGEIVEAFWYDNAFETDVSGKYVLTSDSMSLYGNTYILDALTLKPIANLPNGADYEFLNTGKLLVYYYDFENNDNYVEFEVEIEDAVRCFPFDEDSEGCDCFDGYPTPEDFE